MNTTSLSRHFQYEVHYLLLPIDFDLLTEADGVGRVNGSPLDRGCL